MHQNSCAFLSDHASLLLLHLASIYDRVYEPERGWHLRVSRPLEVRVQCNGRGLAALLLFTTAQKGRGVLPWQLDVSFWIKLDLAHGSQTLDEVHSIGDLAEVLDMGRCCSTCPISCATLLDDLRFTVAVCSRLVWSFVHHPLHQHTKGLGFSPSGCFSRRRQSRVSRPDSSCSARRARTVF